MNEIILNKLKDIERDYDVKILYACESGSRAWGFASPDSDYDVRFIYVHRRDHYLSIMDHRDVIDLPVNELLDINGWELRKALRLFRKSNAPLFEWFQSPVVYRANEKFLEEINAVMPTYFSGRAMLHHYLSMTKGVFENELVDENVKLKKYFYALRPVLAAKWIVDRSEVPPMDFPSLRTILPNELNQAVDELLKKKAIVNESFFIERNGTVNSFIGECINYCEQKIPLAKANGETDELNILFRKFIYDA